MKRRFIEEFNSVILSLTGLSENLFSSRLNVQIGTLAARGTQEKLYWEAEIKNIEQYSKEEAIRELIKSKKIYEKIAQIDAYIKGLQKK